ncbi:MAG: TonB-dependent receptor, partial [Bacteroidetes bacterium]
EHIFRVGQRFALVPGIRIEHIDNQVEGRININGAGEMQEITPDTRSRSFLLAGFGAEFHATATSEAYFNISQSYRPVAFSDLTPPATSAVIDPDLKDARGWIADLGYRGRWHDWLNYDVSLFYLRYANRIGTLARQADDGSVYQFRTNLSTSIHRGIESYVEWSPLTMIGTNRKWGRLNLFASLSWIHAVYSDLPVTTVSNGTIVETNLKDKRVDNAPRYVHRFGATYVLRGFSATWQLSSVSDVFSDAANTIMPSANGQVGKIEGYQVMDFSATWKFRTNFSLRAGVNNLADVRYATRRTGGYPGPGLLPGEGRTWYAGIGLQF